MKPPYSHLTDNLILQQSSGDQAPNSECFGSTPIDTFDVVFRKLLFVGIIQSFSTDRKRHQTSKAISCEGEYLSLYVFITWHKAQNRVNIKSI